MMTHDKSGFTGCEKRHCPEGTGLAVANKSEWMRAKEPVQATLFWVSSGRALCRVRMFRSRIRRLTGMLGFARLSRSLEVD